MIKDKAKLKQRVKKRDKKIKEKHFERLELYAN